MIKKEDLKYKNNLYYYKDKLFTGQVINYYGDKFWYKEEKFHRDNDLPAMECNNGDKYWYKEGKLNREDGPAIEYSNGDKFWFKEGKRHRKNGPAIQYSDEPKSWYYNGEFIHCKDNKEFEKIIKLKIFA